MKKAGSPVISGHCCSHLLQEAFRKVDLDYVLKAASTCHETGVKQFFVVTAMGANAKSFNLYLRTKGEVDEGLKGIGFERLGIFHPAMLLTSRDHPRPAEAVAQALMYPANYLLWGPMKKLRGISVVDLAKGMVGFAESEPKEDDKKVVVLAWDEIMHFAAKVTH